MPSSVLEPRPRLTHGLFLFLATGVSFPKNFQATIKSIVRRLFRVYAHLYNHHFAQLCALSIEGASLSSPSREQKLIY